MKILSVAFENFYSFKERQEIHFAETTKRLGKDSGFLPVSDGSYVSKANIVIGGNGSGKTNALKVIPFLAWFIRSSAQALKIGDSILFRDFRFDDDVDSASNFELTFLSNGVVYKYFLSIDKRNDVVVSEELYRLNGSTGRYNYIFKRWHGEDGVDVQLDSKYVGFNKNSILSFLRDNCSVVSASMQLKNSRLRSIVDDFIGISTNVGYDGLVENELFGAYLFFNKNMDMFKKAKDMMIDCGLGMHDIRMVRKKINDKYVGVVKNFISAMKSEIGIDEDVEYGVDESYDVEVKHIVNGRVYSIDMKMESSGTQKFFSMMQYVLPALGLGGVAIIDELEQGLHPHLVEKIVQLFLNPGTNPNDAQLICSTHSLNVLDHLTKEQIFLVEKDEETLASEVWKLSDMEGVRTRDNYLQSYLAGRYGAVPRI